MEKTVIRPFVWMAGFVLVVGMACGLGGSDPTPTPAPPPTNAALPTNPPPPTNLPQPTSTLLPTNPPPPPATDVPQVDPTDAPPVSNDPAVYYIEEFEGDLSNYTYTVFNGVDGGSDMIFLNSGELSFNIENRDTWVYVSYTPWIYGDVRIGISAENRGVNSQRVSLTCRISSDGWFEFNIGGDGLYEIWVYDDLNKNFFLLGNGGSTDIRLGRDTNIYIAECIGNELRLFINDKLVKTINIPNDYRFMDEGAVGFAVSSFDSIPVLINVDWFGIEAP